MNGETVFAVVVCAPMIAGGVRSVWVNRDRTGITAAPCGTLGAGRKR